MKRNRDNDVEMFGIQSRIKERHGQPLSDDMPETDLFAVFELMDQASHHTSRSIAGHGGFETQRLIRAVAAGELSVDRAAEWLGAAGAKRRHDSRSTFPAFAAQILVPSDT